MKFDLTLARTKILLFATILLMVVALPLTVYLVRQQQNLQQEAAAAPVLSLIPSSVSDAKVGDNVELAVELRLGKNKTIKKVHFVIEYDPEKLDFSGGFENQSGFEELPQTQEFVEGRIRVTLETDDPAKFIKERKTLGSLKFVAMEQTGGDKTTVRFVRGESQVVGVKNIYRPDIVNADIVIAEGEPICPAKGKGECSWDAAPNADSYQVKIWDVAGENQGRPDLIIFDEKIDAPQTKVEFEASPGKTYRCEVFAKNECGEGTPGEDSATCSPRVTSTPTPTPSVTPTPTVTPTVTPTPTKVPSLTPTKSPTPTPTTTVINTPTPTIPTVVVNTPTPTTQIAQVPPPAKGGVVTPQPTLVPTGSGDALTVGAFVGTALLILGGIFFFIF